MRVVERDGFMLYLIDALILGNFDLACESCELSDRTRDHPWDSSEEMVNGIIDLL